MPLPARSLLCTAALGASMVCTADAWACGGTFCDSGPTAMPVDQTGENILFVQDGPAVEAHIQIQYEGEAARFAWVIPVPSVPTFSVGSQMLFAELLRASVPAYGITQVADQCAAPFFPGPVAASAEGGTARSDNEGSSGGGGGGPSVVLKQSVGAFDITVLQGGTATELMTWLQTNSYAVLPGTEPLVAQYVQENSLFAAVKLTGGTGVDEIHPLVMRYEFGYPCVPLRLTAVAALANMGVRAFFLGDARVVPRRYHHATVNPLRIDWINNGSNYRDVVINAVDDPAAGGQAFITEYAGPSSRVVTRAFYDARWDASAIPMEADRVTAELARQGLLFCFSGSPCTMNHPLLRPLLEEYLPVPAGVDEGSFWGDTQRFSSQVDATAWKPDEFKMRFAERIVTPAIHAEELVRTHAYLTRLFTALSPDEMTLDPEFHERADLPEVDNTQQVATQRLRCDGTQVVILPDGREVELGESLTWPTFNADMPWVETVQDIPETGDITTLADRTETIDRSLSTYNRQTNPSARGPCACNAISDVEPAAAMGLAAVALLRAARRRVRA